MSHGHEYVAKYEGCSHRDLYNRVIQALPHTATDAATRWREVETDLTTLSQNISEDVAAVAPAWRGDGSAEFQNRMQIVSDYSQDLAADAGSISNGLTQLGPAMSTAVSDAHADSPDNTGAHTNLLKLAIGGAATLSPIAAAGGGLVGMLLDKEEADKAHQRMVQTVSNLAATYDVVTQRTWPQNIAPPPPGLPGGPTGTISGGTGTGATPVGPSGGQHPPAAGGGAPAAPPPMMAQPAPPPMAAQPAPAPGGRPEADTVLLAGAGATAGLGVIGALAAAGTKPSIPMEGAPGKGGLTSTFGGKGVPGVLGREGESPSSVNRAAATAEDEVVHRPPVDPKTGRPVGSGEPADEATARARTAAPQESERAAPRARVASSGTGPGEDGQTHAMARGATPVPGAEEDATSRTGYPGRGGVPDGEADDERLTWLTEDDMVWGQSKGLPPTLG